MAYVWQVCSVSRRAFDGMIERTPVLFPLMLVVIGSLVVFVFSFAMYSSILFRPLASQGTFIVAIHDIPHRYFDGILPEPFTLSGILSGAVDFTRDLVLRLLLLATYFFVVARVLRVESKWENWFGFACWTQIPLILLPGAMFVPGLWRFGTYNRISILVCEIVFLIFPLMWTFFITVRGLQSWTGRRTNLCIGLALIPCYVMFMWYSPAIFPIFVANLPLPI